MASTLARADDQPQHGLPMLPVAANLTRSLEPAAGDALALADPLARQVIVSRYLREHPTPLGEPAGGPRLHWGLPCLVAWPLSHLLGQPWSLVVLSAGLMTAAALFIQQRKARPLPSLADDEVTRRLDRAVFNAGAKWLALSDEDKQARLEADLENYARHLP